MYEHDSEEGSDSGSDSDEITQCVEQDGGDVSGLESSQEYDEDSNSNLILCQKYWIDDQCKAITKGSKVELKPRKIKVNKTLASFVLIVGETLCLQTEDVKLSYSWLIDGKNLRKMIEVSNHEGHEQFRNLQTTGSESTATKTANGKKKSRSLQITRYLILMEVDAPIKPAKLPSKKQIERVNKASQKQQAFEAQKTMIDALKSYANQLRQLYQCKYPDHAKHLANNCHVYKSPNDIEKGLVMTESQINYWSHQLSIKTKGVSLEIPPNTIAFQPSEFVVLYRFQKSFDTSYDFVPRLSHSKNNQFDAEESKHAPRYASQVLSAGFDQVIAIPHASKPIHYFDTVHKFFQSCIDKDTTDEVENSAHWNRVRDRVLANGYDVESIKHIDKTTWHSFGIILPGHLLRVQRMAEQL